MTYIGVMAFLGYAEKMPGMLKIVAGATVGLSALIALSPVAILVFGPKSDAPPKKKAAPEDEGAESFVDETAQDEELLADESVDDVEAFATDSEADEFAVDDDFSSSTEMEIVDEDAEFDTLADSSGELDFESDDDFAFDDDDETKV